MAARSSYVLQRDTTTKDLRHILCMYIYNVIHMCIYIIYVRIGCGSNLTNWGYAGVGLSFYLPGLHFGPHTAVMKRLEIRIQGASSDSSSSSDSLRMSSSDLLHMRAERGRAPNSRVQMDRVSASGTLLPPPMRTEPSGGDTAPRGTRHGSTGKEPHVGI